MKSRVLMIALMWGCSLVAQNMAPRTYSFEYEDQIGCRFQREMKLIKKDNFVFGKELAACPKNRVEDDFWHSRGSMSFVFDKMSLTIIFGLNAPFLVYREGQNTYNDVNFEQEIVSTYFLMDHAKYPVHVIEIRRRPPPKHSTNHLSIPMLSRIQLGMRLKLLLIKRKLNNRLRVHYSPQIGFMKFEYLHKGGRVFRTEELISIERQTIQQFIDSESWILNPL